MIACRNVMLRVLSSWKLPFIGKETIVQLKRVGEVEDSVVGPGQDLDGKCGVEPRNRKFKNTPQEMGSR